MRVTPARELTVHNVNIRRARVDEADWVVTMIYRMIEEMARYGGETPAAIESVRAHLASPIAEQLAGADACYCIAESEQHERLGLAGAETATQSGCYEPRRQLHVGVVYVMPQARGQGIGGLLINAILAWGRERGFETCDLNVFANNPAKSLYQKLGFSVLQYKMTRTL